MVAKLLVVDDDAASCRLIEAIFESEDIEVVAALDGTTGASRFHADAPDVVILDLHLPDGNGMEFLSRFVTERPQLPVIMLTAHNDVKSAVRAIRMGAFDYLTKPVNAEEVAVVVQRALETKALRSEVEDLRRQLGEGGALSTQMGPSREVGILADQVRTVAATSFSVLVLGETGTGKELVAQAIHRQSERRGHAFIAVDCGAIPDALLESELFGHEKGAFTGAERRKEGRFHVAQGGTVFLDEVGNLPLALQAKLLRVLESRQLQAVGATRTSSMDVRFIAATNDDLQSKVTAGKFRADLYFRLAQYTISLPPLRDRPSDVAHLSRRFLAEVSVELRRPIHDIAPDAVAALERHDWPGNVRELRNVVRQAVLESKDTTLKRAQLQKFLRRGHARPEAGAPPAGRTLREAAEAAARDAERFAISQALRASHGNKSQAARALATDYKTLHLKMKLLGIRARDFTA
ncbi:MAG TPA: sigma-54 dependent transcriptional regulator [Polyangiaceae bacterium]|nr:sigma-54 dependent transcriptional regulator [Polyangiaceae bacterium]